MINVIEIYEVNDKVTVESYSFIERDEAEQKYYQILSNAAICTHDIHSASMLTSEGYFLKSECFKHKEKREKGEVK